MTHGQLFAGIGGFGLAAQWAGIENVWANENDSFCCKVLRKNFPNLEVHEKDIREIGKHNLKSVDIISGGFPCQPFSQAGKRKGKEDNRYLWDEMLRVISEIKPSWVIGENVAGILSMDNGKTFDGICTSLEDEGYSLECYNIPACGIGAWHKRERIWIIAHSDSIRKPTRRGKVQGTNEEVSQRNDNAKPDNTDKFDVTNINIIGRGRIQGQKKILPNKNRANSGKIKGRKTLPHGKIRHNPKTNTNPYSKHGKEPERRNKLGHEREKSPLGRSIYETDWNRNWIEVASELCRNNDGIPKELDKAKRINALGNAIVPQVATEIFKAIKDGFPKTL